MAMLLNIDDGDSYIKKVQDDIKKMHYLRLRISQIVVEVSDRLSIPEDYAKFPELLNEMEQHIKEAIHTAKAELLEQQ